MLPLLLGPGIANGQFVESKIEFLVPIDSRLVLPDFEGETASILLTGRSEDGTKHIGLFAVAEDSVASAPMLSMTVSPEILFFDSGRIGGQMRLLFLTPDGVSVLDASGSGLRTLFEMPSIFRTSSKAPVTELDFLKDVNQDGLEDIVLQDFSGLRVALQTADGFESTNILQIRPEMRSSEGQPHYVVDRLHHFDFTLDGKKDLGIIRDNQFLVFERGQNGFASQSKTLPIDIEILDEASERYEDRVVDIDQSDFQLSRIDKVADLNGDELPDILTITTISSGLFNKRTEYRVHLGRKGANGVSYQSDADAEIPSDGIQIALSLLGEDKPGGIDLVSTSFRVGFGEIISALFSRTVKLNIELYRLGSDPLYPPKPDFRTKVKWRFSLSTGFVNNPAVRFADFDGDGTDDLLLQKDTESFQIRVGEGRDFSSKKLEWLTELPRDGALIRAVDVNRDARQDVLVGFGRGDGEGMRNRLHVLLSVPTNEDSR